MKRKLMKIILVFAVLIFFGCSNDDDYNEQVRVGFGIALEDVSMPLGFSIEMDDKYYVVPVSPTNALSGMEDSSRVLIYFDELSKVNDIEGLDAYVVNVVEWDDILLKNILDITYEIEDSLGNDPIIIQKMWVTGDFLNFKLKFWGNYKQHLVNLVKEPGELTSEDLPIVLELRHNDQDDMEQFLYSAYVSFKLSSIQISGLDSVSFKVSGTNYSLNSYEYNGVYNYGSN